LEQPVKKPRQTANKKLLVKIFFIVIILEFKSF